MNLVLRYLIGLSVSLSLLQVTQAGEMQEGLVGIVELYAEAGPISALVDAALYFAASLDFCPPLLLVPEMRPF